MSSTYRDDSLQLFTLNSNQPLAEEIANHIGVELGKCTVSTFSDGETQINIEESVRGRDVYVIQSTSEPVNDNIMELLILIDALKRASADRKSTRLNSSHVAISYAVFCLKKKI